MKGSLDEKSCSLMESSLAQMTPQIGPGCGNVQAYSSPYPAMLVVGHRLLEAQEAIYALLPIMESGKCAIFLHG